MFFHFGAHRIQSQKVENERGDILPLTLSPSLSHLIAFVYSHDVT